MHHAVGDAFLPIIAEIAMRLTEFLDLRPTDPTYNVSQGSWGGVWVGLVAVADNKWYKIRAVKMAALACAILFFDQHEIEVIKIDGVYVERAEAGQLYIAPAQRYSFIMEAKVDVTRNYAFSAVLDLNPDFRRPTTVFPINAIGCLEYNPALGFPTVDSSSSAMVRDTVVVNENSTAVLRFKADNPDVRLLHCHLEWHMPLGLTAKVIEDPIEN
ncbi:hypothetical protein VTK56DRAFT_819 [Thermocarpiscus australiensis]